MGMNKDVSKNYNTGRLNGYLKGIDGFIAGGCFRSIFDGAAPTWTSYAGKLPAGFLYTI